MDADTAPQPFESPVQQTPKRFPVLPVLLSLFVLLLLFSSGYLAYQNIQLTKQLTLRATPTPTPTPSSSTSTFQGTKYDSSFSYPSYFIVEPQTSTYSKEERVNFRNTTSNSSINLLEFRAAEGYWLDPSKYSKSIQIGDYTFWYFTEPTYSYNNGLVVAMAQKGKELIYEFRFNGAKDFNDPTIQLILTTFSFVNDPAITPTKDYICPPSGWVDCMPIMDEAKKKACSPEAMTWYEANCPNFQGGAL